MGKPPASADNYSQYEKFYPKGSVVFREYDEGSTMFVVRSGEAQVTKAVRGREKILSVMKKGDFFGEMAVLNQRPRSATVTCTEDSVLLSLDAKTFESFMRSDIEIAIRLIQKLSQRLQRADDLIENLMLGDDDSMVVNTLKKAMQESKTITSEGIQLEVSAKELAGRIGLDLNRIKEILSKLKRLELITVKGKAIIIPSKPRLLKYQQLLEVQSQIVRQESDSVG